MPHRSSSRDTAPGVGTAMSGRVIGEALRDAEARPVARVPARYGDPAPWIAGFVVFALVMFVPQILGDGVRDRNGPHDFAAGPAQNAPSQ